MYGWIGPWGACVSSEYVHMCRKAWMGLDLDERKADANAGSFVLVPSPTHAPSCIGTSGFFWGLMLTCYGVCGVHSLVKEV